MKPFSVSRVVMERNNGETAMASPVRNTDPRDPLNPIPPADADPLNPNPYPSAADPRSDNRNVVQTSSGAAPVS
jgi:hypothetical protein